jgi:hypothetical protein
MRTAVQQSRETWKIVRRQGSAGIHVSLCIGPRLGASRTDSHSTDGHGAFELLWTF